MECCRLKFGFNKVGCGVRGYFLFVKVGFVRGCLYFVIYSSCSFGCKFRLYIRLGIVSVVGSLEYR